MRNLLMFLASVLLVATSPMLTFAQEQTGTQQLSAADIDTLVAPIALYPDPLISQILPAATYPDDIQAAANWLAQNPNNFDGIDAQRWDLSVKAVAHYPQVIQKMSGDMDWTLALGQAYSLQQQDVLESVQRLRETARGAGTLQTTPQQRVIVEDNVIRIVPANPRMIYVPYYDPEVVYVAGPPHRRGLLGFTAGFMIGAWLNSDCDWHSHRVYYHGWVGPGWIAYSRPYIRTNHFYVNDSFRNRAWGNPQYHSRPMHVNRMYVDRHINRYEFNRNRVNRDSHRPSTAMDRINANRERSGRNLTSGGHGQPVGGQAISGHNQNRTTPNAMTGHSQGREAANTSGGHNQNRTTPNAMTGHSQGREAANASGGHNQNRTTPNAMTGHSQGREATSANTGRSQNRETTANTTSGHGHGSGSTPAKTTSGGEHGSGGGNKAAASSGGHGQSGNDTKKKQQ